LFYGLRFFVCATSRATLEVVATFNQLQASVIAKGGHQKAATVTTAPLRPPSGIEIIREDKSEESVV